jgi:hypothetical protein
VPNKVLVSIRQSLEQVPQHLHGRHVVYRT